MNSFPYPSIVIRFRTSFVSCVCACIPSLRLKREERRKNKKQTNKQTDFDSLLEIPEKGGGSKESGRGRERSKVGKDNRWETVRLRGFRHQGCGWVSDIQKCT